MSTVMKSVRDPRAMNHMDPEMKVIHCLLEELAPYWKDPGIQGFPRESTTEKAAQYGKLGIPQESNYRGEPPMPERLVPVDAGVARLGSIDKKVIKTYYGNWADWTVMARKCGMRVPQFKNVLKRARWRIAGFVSAFAMLG